MTTEPAPDTPDTPAIRTTVFTGRWPELKIGGTFSPTTATLFTGPTEAVLVDAVCLREDVASLGDLVADTGKTLTTIVVTHGHADHYFGIAELLQRFPTTRAVALPSVVADIERTMAEQTAQWEILFGDRVVDCTVIPEPLTETTLAVDGARIDVVEVEQADIAPTSIVHVPDAKAVVAGDAVYNEIHPMLGLSSPDRWPLWQNTIDRVEALEPEIVVAGHKRPDSDDRAVQSMLRTTRQYIADFAAAFETASSADELIETMVSAYPGHGNRWTLEFSARQAFAVHRGRHRTE